MSKRKFNMDGYKNANRQAGYEEAGRQGEAISGLAFGDASGIARGLEGTMSQTPRMRALDAMRKKKKRLERPDMSVKPTSRVSV